MRGKLGWLVMALVWAGGLAQAKPPVQWTAIAEPTVVHPGEVANLVLTATIDPKYHIYAASLKASGPVATQFTAARGLEPLGGLREHKPKSKHDQGFNIEVLYQVGKPVFRQPFRVPAEAKPGKLMLGGLVRYQACTEQSCLPPATAKVQAAVTVNAGPVRADRRDPLPESNWSPTPPKAAKGQQAAPVAPVSVADQARAQGLGTFLLVAFLAGLAALLTPCVFPMVPITVSYFTKQAGDNARKRVGLAASYGLGIIGTYTTLGLILAATLGAGGAQRLAANPWMNLFIAALFAVFAFSLFGAFELRLPGGMVNFADRKSDVGGYLGALFMGLTLTLAAFTCTVQFVGGVLVWAANGQYLWPVLGMMSFSLAFALPFVGLALFPQYLASLPKSGGWLETTKVVLGWIELGAAVKFVSNADLVWSWRVLSRELVLGLWAVCALLIVLYLAGWLVMGHAPAPERLTSSRRIAVLAFGMLSVWFLWGLTGAKLSGLVEALLPPPGYGRGAQQARASTWLEDLDEAKRQAAEQHRNILIDFTGVTCTNCRWMEQNMFTQPAVAERVARFVPVRLYTDTGPREQEYRNFQIKQYQTASLPYYVIMRPDGSTVATFDGLTRDEGKFTAFLDQGR